jgi:hypothetical protein
MKFIADDDQLTIRLQGIEIFFGLQRTLDIQKSKIVSLDWSPQFTFPQKVWRLAGSSIVGILYAGHFRGNGERYFFYLRNPHGLSWVGGGISAENVLVITLQNHSYNQVVLTCKADIADGLVGWWHDGARS